MGLVIAWYIPFFPTSACTCSGVCPCALKHPLYGGLGKNPGGHVNPPISYWFNEPPFSNIPPYLPVSVFWKGIVSSLEIVLRRSIIWSSV